MPDIIEIPLWCLGLGLLIAVIARLKAAAFGGRLPIPFWQEWGVYSAGVLLAIGLAAVAGQIL